MAPSPHAWSPAHTPGDSRLVRLLPSDNAIIQRWFPGVETLLNTARRAFSWADNNLRTRLALTPSRGTQSDNTRPV
jgi:hypothetical protein